MHGVMKNIAHLCGRRRWGSHGWERVVVSIVADGRKVINKRILNVLASMGVYQAGIAKNMVGEKPVQAHLYEVGQVHSLALQSLPLPIFPRRKLTFNLLVYHSDFCQFRHGPQRRRQSKDSVYYYREYILNKTRRLGYRSGTDLIVYQGKKHEKDQFASMVL